MRVCAWHATCEITHSENPGSLWWNIILKVTADSFRFNCCRGFFCLHVKMFFSKTIFYSRESPWSLCFILTRVTTLRQPVTSAPFGLKRLFRKCYPLNWRLGILVWFCVDCICVCVCVESNDSGVCGCVTGSWDYTKIAPRAIRRSQMQHDNMRDDNNLLVRKRH